MPKFRKKPVVIEAHRFDEDLTAAEGRELAAWCGGQYRPADPPALSDTPAIFIDTLEGTHRADPGDFIIKGVAGEFYPCKPEIFADTYEPAE